MKTAQRIDRMWSRVLWILALIPVVAGLAAAELTAQVLPVRDGFVANRAPYLYAAADFGIDPLEVTFTKDIVPILQRGGVRVTMDTGEYTENPNLELDDRGTGCTVAEGRPILRS